MDGRRLRSRLAACGHGPVVSQDRCWDCHLANLRKIGQGRRADRLVEVRRQHDEGRFDPDALLDGLADRLMTEFARRYHDRKRGAA